AASLRLAARYRTNTYRSRIALNTDAEADLADTVAQALGTEAQYRCVELQDRNHAQLGVLVLQLKSGQQYTGQAQRAFQRFVQELSGAAAVAIETRLLVEAQQRLLDAIIKLLANAIDAKSPYTGGHCERVPVLADSLLKQAIAADSGPYAEF